MTEAVLAIDIRARRGGFMLEAAFELPASGVTAILGPSGSGKTTLIGAIAGIVKPSRGRIALAGETLFDARAGIDVPVERRGCGVVFQDARLFPHLSVARNLAYGSKRRRGRPITQEADHVVDMLGIGHLAERRPATLSGGERQRVAIGRALLSQPRLLLLDEPLSAVDPDRKGEILPYLERLRDEARLPILLVSHALDEVLRLSRQVVLIEAGRCVGAGPTASILSDRSAAGGQHISVLDGTVVRHDAEAALTIVSTGLGEVRVPMTDKPLGGALRLVVDARDVALAMGELPRLSIRNRLRAVVERVEPLDAGQVKVTLKAGGGAIRALVTRDAVAELGIAPGRETWCLVKSVAVDRVPS
jgi:molybdate transport system ATP-binding protein